MNPQKILFHCSSLGKLMTEPLKKSDKISKTAQGELIKVFVKEKYGYDKEFTNKFVKKGLNVEEDSLTLLLQHTGVYHEKNETAVKNQFIIGTPDAFTGKTILEAEIIKDVKSRWDMFTFTADRVGEVDAGERWQMQGYMGLTGAPVAQLISTLINTPESIIRSEAIKMLRDAGQYYFTDDDLEKAIELLRPQMTFDHIPVAERIFIRDVERSEDDIQRMYERVKIAREWMRDNLFNN